MAKAVPRIANREMTFSGITLAMKEERKFVYQDGLEAVRKITAPNVRFNM